MTDSLCEAAEVTLELPELTANFYFEPEGQIPSSFDNRLGAWPNRDANHTLRGFWNLSSRSACSRVQTGNRVRTIHGSLMQPAGFGGAFASIATAFHSPLATIR